MQYVTVKGARESVIYWERKYVYLQRTKSPYCRGLSIGWKNEGLVVIISAFLFTVIVLSPVC